MKLFLLHTVFCTIFFTLGFFWNPLWFWIPIVLGLNLIQSAFTDFCPISRMLGVKSKSKFKSARGSKSAPKS
ncbi:MAG: DUF2892 domain-containing protein [Verrucomicrobia bacterium]|nr:DUF2892 domain-containing protein [Verrucomicrobiota bacterium]MCH8527270.1 DUF2892 domain-containing protein [Kiritimatiellia bacterium]